MSNNELLKGTLATIILRLLQERGKLYGYEITQIVRTLSEGKILIKEGSLYPALHKLVADGFVTTEEVFIGKRVRKYYCLTPKGTEEAKTAMDELLGFLRTIHHIITAEPAMNYVPA